MTYAEQYHYQQLFAMTTTLINAGVSADEASDKAASLLAELRLLSVTEAQRTPIEDPNEAVMQRQAAQQQALIDQLSQRRQATNKDKAIDYDGGSDD